MTLSQSLSLPAPLWLVGAGKMGCAMASGWLEEGLAPALISVQDPDPSAEAMTLFDKFGVPIVPLIKAGGVPPSVVVLAVKPQIMDDVLAHLKPGLGGDTLLLSIAAGRTIDSIAKHFSPSTAVVRSMPNTPASVGRGMTVAVANAQVSEGQKQSCTQLLSAVGEVAWLDDEGLMDAVTALSGSGPAYIFLLAECLAEAGVAAGLDHELAAQLARATISGAGELLRLSDLDAEELRQNVTSKGGTTAAALEVLMSESGLKDLMKRAVAVAKARSEELAGN